RQIDIAAARCYLRMEIRHPHFVFRQAISDHCEVSIVRGIRRGGRLRPWLGAGGHLWRLDDLGGTLPGLKSAIHRRWWIELSVELARAFDARLAPDCLFHRLFG